MNTYLPPEGIPRRVPFVLFLRVLFLNNNAMTGWAGLLFAMLIFYFTESGFSLRHSLAHLVKGSETIEAQLTGVEDTGRKVNDASVFSYTHHFNYKETEYHQTTEGLYLALIVNAPVTIRFPKGLPEWGQIEGIASSGIPLTISLGLIGVFFPFCTFLIVSGVLKGHRAVHLLRKGYPGSGILTEKIETGEKTGSQPVYELRYTFTDHQSRPCIAIARSEYPQRLTDQEAEPLLFLPENPAFNVMLDNLPGYPRINAQGGIQYSGNIFMLLLKLSIALLALVVLSINLYTIFSF
jgi:hypothetical protein